MSLNILDSMSSIIGGPVMRQASTVLGESEGGTRAAVRAGVPAMLASLMRNSSDPAGAAGLYRTVTSPAVDAGIDAKFGDILGNRGNLKSTLATGESLFGSMLGNRAGGVANAVSQVAGIKPGSATSLLAMIAPVLMGLLKRQVKQGGLDAGGLSSLLLSQRSSLQKVGLDDRIAGALGFGSLQTMLGSLPEGVHDRIAEPAKAYSTPVGSTPREYVEPPRRRSWLPWAIGAAVAALALAFGLNRFEPNRTTTTAAQRGTATTTEPSRRLASVYFEPGQANIDAADQETLAEVASSAKASGTPVAVTGYTDRSGNVEQNIELAKDRADAVREALISEGVPESSIEMKAPAFTTGTGTAEEARRVEIVPAK